MENFKRLLPRALLLSFVIKMLLVSPSFADASIVLVLGLVAVAQSYLENGEDVKEIKETVTKNIADQNILINKQNEALQIFAIEHSKMKTNMEGLKLKNEFVGGSGGINKRAI